MRGTLALGMALWLPAIACAADWPQFRGPTGQGIGDATNLPVEWSDADGKNIAWKTPIPGRGWSSPVVLGEQVWMTTATEEGRSLRAVCVDLTSGKLRHDVEVFRHGESLPINPKNTHASPTPVIEPGRLYVHFGTLGTACLDTLTAKVLWRNEDLKLEHKEGPGSSPILVGNLLVIHCDGLDVQYVVALDKATGRPVWKAERSVTKDKNPDFNKAYATPLVVEVDGQRQIISPGAHRVSAYDPADGRELWWCDYPGFSNVPRPVFGHGLLFVGTGYPRAQLWAIRAGGSGDVTQTHIVWKQTNPAPANPSPILVENELYFASDRGIGICLDAHTGKEHWKERLEGNYSASPVLADGKLYFCSEQGVTHVVKPGQSVELLASNTLESGIMASPAVVDEALVIRTETHLYRIEKSRAAAGQ